VPRSNPSWSRRISAVNVLKIPFLVRLFIRYSDSRIVVTGGMSSCFLEKLYQYEHPRHVAQFDAVVNEVDFIGHWISRHWVKGTFVLRVFGHAVIFFSKPRCRLEAAETEDARAIPERPCSRLSVLPRSCYVRTRWLGAQHFRADTYFAQGVVMMIHQGLLLMIPRLSRY
jgi:hypothetical protein